MVLQSTPKVSTALAPVPAAFLSFGPEHGSCCLPVQWLGMVCTMPVTISASFRAEESVMSRLHAATRFAIHLPPREMPIREDFRKELAAKAGELCVDDSARRALFAKCPVRIECCHVDLRPFFGQALVRGEIVGIEMDGRHYGAGGGVDFCRLNPLGFARDFSDVSPGESVSSLRTE